MTWTPKNPENKPILDFMHTSQFLLVDLGSGSRATIRKLLKDMESKHTNVQIEESLDAADKRLEQQKPQVVFLDANQGFGPPIIEWIGKYLATPTPGPKILILITANQTPAMAAQIAELEVDMFLSLPFTYQDILDRFLEVLKLKVTPTPYQKIIDEGKGLITQKKWPEAFEIFEKAKKASNEPSLACFYQGKVLQEQGKYDDALKVFLEGLKKNSKHYKCLSGCFDVYLIKKDFAEAYEYAKRISGDHPINPARLPDFIRVCVYNSHFPDVLNFYEFVVQSELKEDQVVRSVAAGMLVCAKFFLKSGKKNEAIEAFKKTERLAVSRPPIHKEIIASLIRAKLDNEANDFMKRASEEIQSSMEVTLATIERWSDVAEQNAFVLQKALEWIKKGTKEPRFYVLAIQKSISMKRSADAIKDLKDQAATAFPAKAKEFEAMQ